MPARGMAKRSREAGQAECPVCLEPFGGTARTQTRASVASFQCDHRFCRACDARLLEHQDHRCPVCRAARRGMTEQQAEPRADRNAADPADMLVNELMAQGFEPLLQRGPDGQLQRPETGHIMIFPIDRSGEGQFSIPAQVAGHLPPNQTVTTSLTDLREMLPPGLADALLDLPSVSLVEWRSLARNRRVAAPRGARPEGG